jgi:hypothetical protein
VASVRAGRIVTRSGGRRSAFRAAGVAYTNYFSPQSR